MTWAKYGTEFFDQLAEFDFPAELDDACQLVHTQVLHYLYSTEDLGASFLKKNLRRIVSSPKADDAAHALVKAGAWKVEGNRYKVIHHEEVFRQSLGYQIGKREGDRDRKRTSRAKAKGSGSDGPKGGGVTEDVTRDVLEVQTDSQTTSSYNEGSTDEKLNVDYSTGEVLDAPSSSAGSNFAATSDGGEEHVESSAPREVDPVREFMRQHAG